MLRVLIFCALLALLCSIAFGLGSYALAPGGAYVDWGTEDVSHDPHRYLWFFQVPSTGWYELGLLGLFVGAGCALFVVPITCAACGLLFWNLPALKRRFLAVSPLRLSFVVIALGLLTGAAATIISGKEPGIP
jgi:hypothetical protein